MHTTTNPVSRHRLTRLALAIGSASVLVAGLAAFGGSPKERAGVAGIVDDVAEATGLAAEPAEAHSTSDWVYLYNPIIDGDSIHTDQSAWWAWNHGTSPAGHHIVYSNWGWMNDWSLDVFARAEGKRIVTPFGSKTNSGHAVETKVVSVKAGCRSGNIADGGYRVTLEARDTVTGVVLGRADLMHVDRPQVSAGQKLGGWTTIGFTKKFRQNSCYDVSTTWGVHVHLEVINQHKYACYINFPYEQPLTELTRIGKLATHNSGQRAHAADEQPQTDAAGPPCEGRPSPRWRGEIRGSLARLGSLAATASSWWLVKTRPFA